MCGDSAELHFSKTEMIKKAVALMQVVQGGLTCGSGIAIHELGNAAFLCMKGCSKLWKASACSESIETRHCTLLLQEGQDREGLV